MMSGSIGPVTGSKISGKNSCHLPASNHLCFLFKSALPDAECRRQELLSPDEGLDEEESVRCGSLNQKDAEKEWGTLAAQTNTQLLHVLCDLVQAFIDTEKLIEVSLTQLGFSEEHITGSPADDVLANKHTFLTSGSDGSKRHQEHVSVMDTPVTCNNNKQRFDKRQHSDVVGDFCHNGPDLINSSTSQPVSQLLPIDLLLDSGSVRIDDDVVLGFSKRLRAAVDRMLHLMVNSSRNDAASVSITEKDQTSSQKLICKSASMPTGSSCDLKQEIQFLQHELREAVHMNQILQQEVNKKHNALSALRAQIENQSILDAKFLKRLNEDLETKVAVAERKIHRQAEIINQLRSGSSGMKGDWRVTESTPEKGRRDHRPCSPLQLHFNDMDSIIFDSSDELLNLDGTESLSLDKWDLHSDHSFLHSNRINERQSFLNETSDDAYCDDGQLEREKRMQELLEAKDEEINVLRNQMKLAQEMIARALPDQKIHEYLDVDLFGSLSDVHRDKSPNSPGHGNGEVSDRSSINSLACDSNLGMTSFKEVLVIDSKVTQIETVIEKLVSENAQVIIELEDTKAQNVRLQREIEFLRNQKRSYDRKMRDQERETMNLKLTMEKKEKELVVLKSHTKKESEQEVILLQQKVQVLGQEISSKEDRMQRLSRLIDVMTCEIDQIKSSYVHPLM